jgi:hypothetical protein
MVHGIIAAEGVDVPAAVEEDWILRNPPPGLRIIPAAAELDEAGVGIVKPTLEPERLEAGVGVAQDSAKGIVVEPLRDFAAGKDALLALDYAAESVALEGRQVARRQRRPARLDSAAPRHASPLSWLYA